MAQRNKKSNNDGLAFAGLLGVGLGALGTWIWSKIKEEDQEKEQQKQLNLLKNDISQKNKEIEEQKKNQLNLKETDDSYTDSDNLLDNPNLFCPITNVLMDDPIIVTKCGHTFQKDALESWMKKKKTCPLCAVEISEDQLKPNYTMKAFIADLRKKK